MAVSGAWIKGSVSPGEGEFLKLSRSSRCLWFVLNVHKMECHGCLLRKSRLNNGLSGGYCLPISNKPLCIPH